MFDALSVLYLEDEPLIAYDTSEHLKELGFAQVCAVYHLNAAEEAARDIDFDLAILDINVDKGQTSLALGAALAARGVPVIFATGNSCDQVSLREAGYSFLSKPFSLLALTDEIKVALNLQAAA